MPVNYKALEAQFGAIQPQSRQGMSRQVVKPKKKKNFFLDQISTVGGILGGIGGSFISPLAGTAAGGAVGSGLGEAIENLITGEKDKSKNVLKEAALGGVFVGGPLKLGKAVVIGGAKALGREAAEAGAREVGEGALKRTGRGLLGDAWGIKSGVKVGGKTITPQRAGELQRFITKEVGVPKAANADMVFSRLTTFQDDAGRAISSAVKTNAPLKTRQLASTLEGKFSKVIGANAKDNPVATDIITHIRRAKTPEDLWNVRRNIDDTLISFTRNPNAAVPGAEQFARSARAEINKTLNKAVPGLSGLNKTYSKALEASELVAQAAKTPKGARLPGMLGGVAGGTTQRARSAAGQAFNAIPEIGRGTAKAVAPSARGIATRQIGQNLLLPRGQADESTPEQRLEEVLMQQQGLGDFEQPQSQNPYSKENLMADIQRDPTNAQEYVQYYAMLEEVFNPEIEQPKPLTGEAQKRALTAQSGLRSLDTLAQTLESDPGAFQRQALPNPLGITARLTGTTDVRAATDNVVDVIARLRSGAAITDDEARRFARLLPLPGDSQDSARRKIENVMMELQSFAQDPGGGSLEDQLMQLQGAY